MQRWSKLITLIFVVLLVLGVCIAYLLNFERQRNKPYNILMISVDTLRSDHLSIYGYPKDTAPNITAWAKKDGIIFNNAYTQIPITYPSFASTMTGLSPYQTSIFNNGKTGTNKDGSIYIERNDGNKPLPDSAPTLAELLKKQNYITGAFVINSNLRASSTGMNRGFDDYYVAGDNYHLDGTDIDGFIQDGLAWLDDKKNSSQPFFLWMHFLDPHEPFTPFPENQCRFAGSQCSQIEKLGISYFTNKQKELEGCHTSPLPGPIISSQEALYDAELYQTDSYIGEILSYVRENHLDKNTIIIFYSDHGEGFDHNYYFTHSEELYESAVKIPYIISTPKTIGKSHISSTFIDNTQTLPTLLSLVGLGKNVPMNLQGKSFGLQDNTNNSEKMNFYINQSKTKFAIRQGNMKYIYTNLPKGKSCLAQVTEELYDLSVDPKETTNLVVQQRLIADKLRNLLLQHINDSNIQFNERDQSTLQTVQRSTDNQNVLKTIREMGY